LRRELEKADGPLQVREEALRLAAAAAQHKLSCAEQNGSHGGEGGGATAAEVATISRLRVALAGVERRMALAAAERAERTVTTQRECRRRRPRRRRRPVISSPP
jgi:hypothetical protein